MFELLLTSFLLGLICLILFIIWRNNARKYISSGTVASAYDAWTQDKLLERLWGEHIHLGFYPLGEKNTFTRLQREYEMLDHTRKQLAARTALKESFPDIKEN